MKKILFTLLVTAFVSSSFANTPVNDKVLKIFSKMFPAVENAKWYDYDNYYEAYFDKDDIKCRVRFDIDGKIISTIRYYGEKNVSPFLKAKLANRYPGKTIFGVTEVNSDFELNYHFVLEDDKSWMHVKSDGTGAMEVTDKFKKAEN
ncbi:MAG TPA: hypothetical protein VGB71_15860 [Flavisolibacter sp.]|jgi:hypothetical protein